MASEQQMQDIYNWELFKEKDEGEKVDEDSAYEMWREDWGEKLHRRLKEVFTEFIMEGYYKDNPETFLEHAEETLKTICKE